MAHLHWVEERKAARLREIARVAEREQYLEHVLGVIATAITEPSIQDLIDILGQYKSRVRFVVQRLLATGRIESRQVPRQRGRGRRAAMVAVYRATGVSVAETSDDDESYGLGAKNDAEIQERIKTERKAKIDRGELPSVRRYRWHVPCCRSTLHVRGRR